MATNTLQQVFSSLLQENFYASAEFLMRSQDHSSMVQGSVVHVPNAGAKPNVEKSRSVFPAVVTDRVDDDLTYLTAPYSVDPITIKNAEEFQTNYSIQSSVTSNAISSLRERICDEALYAWASGVTINGGGATQLPASSVLLTTGADGVDNAPTGATGNRKSLTYLDFKAAAKELDKQDVSQSGRVAILPPEMYHELIADDKILSHNIFGTGEAPLATGSVARVWGFDIYTRSKVNLYSTAGALKAPNAAVVATDNYGALLYQDNFVCRADGMNNIYTNSGDGNGDATYYGHIISGEKMFGSSRLRTDGKGVIAIYQAAV